MRRRVNSVMASSGKQRVAPAAMAGGGRRRCYSFRAQDRRPSQDGSWAHRAGMPSRASALSDRAQLYTSACRRAPPALGCCGHAANGHAAPRATEQRDELAAPHGLSSRPRVEGARKLTLKRDCKSTEVSVIARADLLLVVIQTIISTSQIDDRSRRDFRWFGRLS